MFTSFVTGPFVTGPFVTGPFVTGSNSEMKMFKTSLLAILVMLGAVFAPNFLTSNAAGQKGGNTCDVQRLYTICPPSTQGFTCSEKNSHAGTGVLNAYLNSNQTGVVNCSAYIDTHPTLPMACGARIGIKVTSVCTQPSVFWPF